MSERKLSTAINDNKSRTTPHSYLIRIWEAHTNDKHTWRAFLERPGLKERLGFPNIEGLFAFINKDLNETYPIGSYILDGKSIC